MPRAKHGGARQGTPGKAYANRTDLATNMGSQTPEVTAAAGGVSRPRQPEPARMPLTPDTTPSPTDPSARPYEPLTAPPPMGMGGPAVDETVMLLRSLAAVSHNPDVRRLLARMENR